MFNTLAAKVVIGAAALAAVGGTTALAATPAATAAASQPAKKAADVRQGVIIKLSDTAMRVERTVKDKTTKATTKDDVEFAINADTKVYHQGSKDPVGHDALKLGERVRVRFAEAGGQKTAKRVVILHDIRAGKVIAKGADYFVIHTKNHGDVHVTVTDKTRFTTGHKKDGTDGTFAALKVGDRAIAAGEEDSQHNFDATRVRYNEPTTAKPATTKAQ